ncbi:2-dehydro-3-deoxygluconokinase [Sinobaca qinghaiensis]|uniref:2-dehydro-3-deoxygluconokinase n=1 Tax=Sinobaca qinghaiensis TaxID=342944 RepID=A0A419V8H0_9BACL|nr:sugar kinase [Sinobaca qinghaiensis]RKD76330.1 2-dehydro-3-deoxygluconokinase [Sinobaca qinghaiensis]
MDRIVTLGEIMLRLSPPAPYKMKQSETLCAFYGGAEANVAVAFRNLGNSSTFLTALPDNTPGDAAIAYLNREGVDTSLIERTGRRLGIYYIEEGTAQRPASVTYDRAYSSFSEWIPGPLDWDSIFAEVDVLHTTGITLALGEAGFETAELVIKEAKKRGVQVSFDFNYRSKLWTKEQAKSAYEQILPYVDICFGSALDLTLTLQWPEEEEQRLFASFMKKYDITWFVTSRRTTLTNTHHQLEGTIQHKNGKTARSGVFEVNVVDRIGGGDAFAAGFLDQLSNQTESAMEEAVVFATATGVLQHTIKGDAFLLARQEVKNFMNSQRGSGVLR